MYVFMYVFMYVCMYTNSRMCVWLKAIQSYIGREREIMMEREIVRERVHVSVCVCVYVCVCVHMRGFVNIIGNAVDIFRRTCMLHDNSQEP